MIRLDRIIEITVLVAMLYYTFRLIQVLVKMRQTIIFPSTVQEVKALRKYPQKTVDNPTYKYQKSGFLLNILAVLFIAAMFSIGMITEALGSNHYLFMLAFLVYSYLMLQLNLFAVIDDGLLIGSRFIPWERIKKLYFTPIDVDHRYYGHTKEANGGYVLKIKTRIGFRQVIIMSEDLKHQLSQLMHEHVATKGKAAEKVHESS